MLLFIIRVSIKRIFFLVYIFCIVINFQLIVIKKCECSAYNFSDFLSLLVIYIYINQNNHLFKHLLLKTEKNMLIILITKV